MGVHANVLTQHLERTSPNKILINPGYSVHKTFIKSKIPESEGGLYFPRQLLKFKNRPIRGGTDNILLFFIKSKNP